MAYRKDWGQPQIGGLGFFGTRKAIGRCINVLAADVNGAGNQIGIFSVPPGFIVDGILFSATDMDTGGAPTLSFSLGDAGSAFRYLNADTIARAGGVTTTLAAGGLLYKNAVETEIILQVSGVAQVGAAGTVDVYLFGTVAP